MLFAINKTCWGRRNGLGVALVLVSFAGGCVFNAPGDRPLPALQQIRSQPLTVDLPNLSNMDAGSRPIASVVRIALPLRTSLNDVWSQVDEQVIPALVRGVWQANGLRIGVISRSDMGSFFEALPAVYGQNVSRMAVTEHLMPLCVSPRLGKAVTVDLTVPPWSVRETQVRRGKLQLLMRVGSDVASTTSSKTDDSSSGSISHGSLLRVGHLVEGTDAQRLYLELVPHHNLPKASLLPRSALDKQLDGQVFEDLAIRVGLSADQIIVLGLYWPWPTVPPDNEDTLSDGTAALGDTDQSPTSAPADTGEVEPIDDPADLPQAPVAPPLLNHIGRSLFTSLRMGQPAQTILLLAIEPAPQNESVDVSATVTTDSSAVD